MGRSGRREPPAPRARPGHRRLQPARQGPRRARPPRRGPRGLRAGARARRHEPHRAAQRRAASPAEAARDKPPTNGKKRPDKAPATVFIEEMGKTGRARLINVGGPRVLAPLSPGDAVDLVTEGDELVAHVGGDVIGSVEPRIAARLMKLIATGNRYEAAITTIHEAERRADDHHPRGLHPPVELRQGLVPDASPRAALASDRT